MSTLTVFESIKSACEVKATSILYKSTYVPALDSTSVTEFKQRRASEISKIANTVFILYIDRDALPSFLVCEMNAKICICH